MGNEEWVMLARKTMNVTTLIGVLLVGFALVNCQQGQQAQLTADAQLMATLECEARHLKDERFKAANDIRFMEDSLAKQHLSLSAAQSAAIDSLKTTYTQRTEQLALKITKTMDSLFAASYHSPAEREQFDNAVEDVLKKTCQ